MLKPAYGLVESSRLWQLTNEKWMQSQGVYEAHGFPQFFLKRDHNNNVVLLMAKVVDDFLLAGPCQEIIRFRQSMSTGFVLGRFIHQNNLIFNLLHVPRAIDGSIYISMHEYFEKH